MIMVVCPGREPTAQEVVVNLAAAFAEAGDRVLVVTTKGLRPGTPGDLPATRADAPRATVVPVSVPASTVQVPAGGHDDTPPTQPLPVAGGEGSMPSVGQPTEPSGTAGVEPTRQTRRDVTVDEVIARCVPQQVSGVSMLQLGDLLRGPGEVATRGNAVVSAARQIADVVLVDAPGILATPDAEALVRCVDAVIVVAQSFHTTVGQATRSGELLRRSGSPTLGVVLTNVEVRPKDLKAATFR